MRRIASAVGFVAVGLCGLALAVPVTRLATINGAGEAAGWADQAAAQQAAIPPAVRTSTDPIPLPGPDVPSAPSMPRQRGRISSSALTGGDDRAAAPHRATAAAGPKPITVAVAASRVSPKSSGDTSRHTAAGQVSGATTGPTVRRPSSAAHPGTGWQRRPLPSRGWRPARRLPAGWRAVAHLRHVTGQGHVGRQPRGWRVGKHRSGWLPPGPHGSRSHRGPSGAPPRGR
jgi:hypothetical protein